MALTALEQDTISRGIAAARKVLDELKPVLDSLNVIYDAEGGAKETIQQSAIDAVPQWSGLTKAQLDDGMYALTGTLRPAIHNAYTALVHLAARG